jgi:probable rRNA maturation factor
MAAAAPMFRLYPVHSESVNGPALYNERRMPSQVSVKIAPGLHAVPRRWLVRVMEELLALRAMPEAEVGIVISDEDEIRRLNRQYRGVDAATDVLAFSMEGEPRFPSPDGLRHLGEVLISLPRAREQARAYGHPLRHELSILVAHGFLHLLGYDDQQPADKKRMFREQARLLSRLEDLL